jgi:hypothetical protein
MIICPHCGHENPLGTLYCRSCGEKLGMTASTVMGGVAADQAADRANLLYRYSRNALSIGVGLLVLGIVVVIAFEPDLPRVTQPIYSPRSATNLLTEPAAAASWRQADDARIQAILAAETAKLEGAALSLAEWRRAEGVRLVDVVGVRRDRLQAWQADLIAGAQENGSYDGPDPTNVNQRYATTALVALGCLAYPADELATLHGQKALDYLASKTRFIRTLTDKTVRNLVIAALLLGERVEGADLTFYRSLLADGQAPEIAAWAIAFFPPGQGPRSYAQLSKVLGKRPLYAAMLDLQLESQRREPIGTSILDSSALQSFNAWDRVVWGLVAWQGGVVPSRSVPQMVEWSSGPAAAVPAKLADLAGDKAGLALQILAAAGVAQLPPITEAISPRRE